MSPDIDLVPGVGYVVKERRPVYSDSLFRDQKSGGASGLVITRMHPDRVRQERNLGNARVVWLTSTPGEDQHDPTDLRGLIGLVQKFIEDNHGGAVVMFDSLEFLTVGNSISKVAGFLRQLRESIVGWKAVLLLPVDARAFAEGHWALLTQGFHAVDADRP